MTKTYISKKVSNGRAIIDVYADKTSIEVCICSYWLQIFMHKFRDGLARSLKMEANFLGFFFFLLSMCGCWLHSWREICSPWFTDWKNKQQTMKLYRRKRHTKKSRKFQVHKSLFSSIQFLVLKSYKKFLFVTHFAKANHITWKSYQHHSSYCTYLSYGTSISAVLVTVSMIWHF